LDISPKMIAWAKDKLPDENIDFVVADAEELEGAEKYDLITANAVFHWFGDLEKTICQCRNGLRKMANCHFHFLARKLFVNYSKPLVSASKRSASHF